MKTKPITSVKRPGHFKLVSLVFISIFAILITISPLLTKPASAAIVQENSTTCTNGSGSTISCTVTSPTNGNALIATIGARDASTGTVTSITQTGATWAQAVESTNNDASTEIWYALNVSGAGTSITINLSGTYYASAVISEYSGLVTSSALDQTATWTGKSASPVTGTTSTTTQAQQLWIGGISGERANTYSSPTNSFTILGQVTGGSNSDVSTVYLERIVSATGAANSGVTASGNQDSSGAIATFDAYVPPPPTKVVFTTAARTLTAGVCSGAGSVITIQLQDAGNTPRDPYGATVIRITSDSPSETIYSDSSCSTELTNGDISFSTSENTKNFYIVDTRKSSGTWTLTAAKQSGPDTISNGTQSITINAGATSRLVTTLVGETFTDGVGNSGSATDRTAGTGFNIIGISATDNYFNVTTGYGGAKTLAYSGPGNAPDTTAPSYTTSVSFTNGQSTTTLATTLYKAESSTITATDGGSYGYASSSVTVNTGILDHLVVTEAGASFIAGTCNTGTLQARDQWNNNRGSDASLMNMTDTGTTVDFHTTGACGATTTQYTLSGGTASFYYSSDLKQSNFTISATKDGDTQTGITGNILVDPAPTSTLLIRLPGQTFTDGTGITGSSNFTGLRTPNATASTSFIVDIKAVDTYNNLVDSGPNNYTGAKTISWADSVAGNAPDTTSPNFPGSTSFTNGESNSKTITYFNAATNRTVEADDTGTPVSGTASNTFTVQAAVVENYNTSTGSPQTAGVAFNVTITARDDWNNSLGALYSAPAGSYVWTTTAGNAPDTTAPSIGTLSQGDFASGVATKSVTLYKAESGRTFTASEPPASTVTGTSGAVTINAGEVSGAASDSTVTGSSSVVTNVALTVTITLLDTWHNPKIGVNSTYIVISGTGGPSITQPSVNTDASGQTTGDLTWTGTGSQTVTIAINTISLVQNDGSTADADGDLDDTHSVTINLPAGSSRLQGGTTIQGGTTLQ